MNSPNASEHLRSMERLCLEQAKLCLPNLGREALEEMARNYAAEARRLEGTRK